MPDRLRTCGRFPLRSSAWLISVHPTVGSARHLPFPAFQIALRREDIQIMANSTVGEGLRHNLVKIHFYIHY